MAYFGGGLIGNLSREELFDGDWLEVRRGLGGFVHCRNFSVDVGVLGFGEVVNIILLAEEVDEDVVGVVVFIDGDRGAVVIVIRDGFAVRV